MAAESSPEEVRFDTVMSLDPSSMSRADNSPDLESKKRAEIAEISKRNAAENEVSIAAPLADPYGDLRKKPFLVDGVAFRWDQSSHPFWKPSPLQEENKRWLDQGVFGQNGPTYFPEIWEKFCDEVTYFSHAHLNRFVAWDDLGERTQARILAWAPKAKQFIDDCKFSGRQHIFLAFIWHILFDNLFSLDCADKWATEDWAAFGTFRRLQARHISNFDNSYTRSYHDWRYRVAQMLHMRQPLHSDPGRLKAINELGELLGPVDKPTTGGERLDREYPLEELVKKAIHADLYIVSIKPHIMVQMRDPNGTQLCGFPFTDPGKNSKGDQVESSAQPGAHIVMEDQYRYYDCIDRNGRPVDLDGRPVDFISRPSMRMYGRWTKTRSVNRSHITEVIGYDYDVCQASTSMWVAVDMPPPPTFPSRHTATAPVEEEAASE